MEQKFLVTNFRKFGYIPEITDNDVPFITGNNQKLKTELVQSKAPPVSCPPVIRGISKDSLLCDDPNEGLEGDYATYFNCKVCMRAKWPIRPELIPVSVA